MKTVSEEIENFVQNNQLQLTNLLKVPIQSYHKVLFDFFLQALPLNLNYSLHINSLFLSPLKECWFQFSQKVLSGMPLEYIVKKKYFYQSVWEICPQKVLIPRPETEQLISWAHQILKEDIHLRKTSKKELQNRFYIGEWGVGSGALGLSFLSSPDWFQYQKLLNQPLEIEFFGTDIDDSCLKNTLLNFELHQYSWVQETKIHLHHENMFGNHQRLTESPIPLNAFDYILVNPPYIPRRSLISEIKDVDWQTLNFEPHKALFLAEDQFDLSMTQLFFLSMKRLKTGGHFLMEGLKDVLEQWWKSFAEKTFIFIKRSNHQSWYEDLACNCIYQVETRLDWNQNLLFLYVQKLEYIDYQ